MNQTGQRPKAIVLSRVVWLFLLVCGSLYLLVCAGMAIAQRSLVYFPSVFNREQVNQMARSARLERWTNSVGQFIGLKRSSPRQPAEGTVMIMYGNGSTAIGCEHYANDIQSVAAFDVFILEYPGYEDRPGSPSQDSLFNAADETFGVLPTNHPIYLVGESLGSGVASYLAGTYSNKIAGVVLISPFNRLTDVAQNDFPQLPVRSLLVDRFPSDEYLRHYQGKVGVTVDGKDAVVPEKFGLRLYNGYVGPKKLWEFPNGGHCGIGVKPSNSGKPTPLPGADELSSLWLPIQLPACYGADMITLLIATRNAHKAGEIRAILGDRFQLLTLNDFPGAPKIIEDAGTFAGNAAKKAVELARWLSSASPATRHSPAVPKLPSEGWSPAFVLADDSGLEVDALNGAPGVHSARFAALDRSAGGSPASSTGNSPDADNNAKLLRLLKNIPSEKRTAQFHCAIALVPVRTLDARPQTPNPSLFDGVCKGRILFEPRGKSGFGYDPLFVPIGFEQTFAELDDEVKNKLSHRARALEKLKASFIANKLR